MDTLRDRITVFLGAGFSAGAAGIPTMAQWPHRIRALTQLTDGERKLIEDVYGYCGTLSAVIGKSARNLEDIASILSLMDTCGLSIGSLTGPGQSPRAMLELIRKAVFFQCKPELSTDKIAVASRITILSESCDLRIVTTNYDLLVELSCLSRGYTIESGPVFAQRATFGDDSLYRAEGRSQVKLFKLHGSINWFGRGDELQVECETERVPSLGDSVRRMSRLSPLFTHGGGNPAFVLPGPDKILNSAWMREQWSGAASAISTCDQLWFIGYSFPQSDDFMRHFLACALATNASIRRILVINPDLDVLKHRVPAVLGSGPHSEIVSSLPFGFEQVDYLPILRENNEVVVGHVQVEQLLSSLAKKSLLQGNIPNATELFSRSMGSGAGNWDIRL